MSVRCSLNKICIGCVSHAEKQSVPRSHRSDWVTSLSRAAKSKVNPRTPFKTALKLHNKHTVNPPKCPLWWSWGKKFTTNNKKRPHPAATAHHRTLRLHVTSRRCREEFRPQVAGIKTSLWGSIIVDRRQFSATLASDTWNLPVICSPLTDVVTQHIWRPSEIKCA